jgi:hypothetical protein
VVENSVEEFDAWLDTAINTYGHKTFNLVGAASSSLQFSGPTLQQAGERTTARDDCHFGCVTIAERHTSKGNEHQNQFRKSQFGAEWFITQGLLSS